MQTKKQNILFHLILCFCLFISLTSCNESTDTDTPDIITTKEIASLIDHPTDERIMNDLQMVSAYCVSPPDIGENYYTSSYVMNGKVICPGMSEDFTSYAYAVYSPDGSLSETIYAAKPDTEGTLGAYFLLPNQNSICLKSSGTRGICTLYLSDADGNVLAARDIEGAFYSCDTVFDDNIIAIHTDHMIYCFSFDLTLLSQTPYGNQYGPMVQTHEGVIAFAYASGKQWYALQPQTGDITPWEGYQIPEGVNKNAELFYGNGYDAYFKDITGIWGYAKEQGTAELLLEWNKTDYTEKNTDVIAALDASTFFVRVIHPLNNQYEPSILHIDNTASAHKTEIRIGLIRSLENPILLSSLISAFNMQSEEYHLTLIDYSLASYEQSGNVSDPSLSQFEEDLLSGNTPDILVFSPLGQSTYQELLEKDLFFDLSPYLGNALLPNVKDAYSDIHGAIYQMPAFMKLYLLAAKKDVIAGEETFTLADFHETLATLGAREILFADSLIGQGVKSHLLNTALSSFYNARDKTCTFDTPAFHSFIRSYCKDWKSPGANLISGLDDRGYTTSDNLLTEIENARLKFLEVPLSSTELYMIIKMYFPENDVSFFGYPTNGGQAAYMESDLSFAIMKDSEVPRGAMTVLEYFLSDTVQTSPIITQNAFSVTGYGVEHQLCAYPYYYFEQPKTIEELNKTHYTSGYFTKLPDALDRDMLENSQLIECIMSDADREQLRNILFHMPLVGICDSVIERIVIDEIEAYSNGIRSAEETAKIIQSRVSIYLNE